jgi:thiocyanate hydrolase subunit gamma
MSQTHGHDVPPSKQPGDISEFEVLELAVHELAIQKGFSNEDHRRFSEWPETIGPFGGSKLVVKAWTDGDPTHSCQLVQVAERYSALRCRHRRAGR